MCERDERERRDRARRAGTDSQRPGVRFGGVVGRWIGRSAAGVRGLTRDERGAAGVLAVAVIGVLVCATTVAVGLAGAFGARRVAAVAADGAALAAADIASGLRPGSPCLEAARVAEANAARVEACTIDGVVAVVTTAVSYLGVPARSTARAGPPGTP